MKFPKVIATSDVRVATGDYFSQFWRGSQKRAQVEDTRNVPGEIGGRVFLTGERAAYRAGGQSICTS